jgi:hypothetical protein
MVKYWVATKNITFQLQNIKKLAKEKFFSILKNSGCQCKHAQVEGMYTQINSVDNAVEEMVINPESYDSNKSEEGKDISLEGIFPFLSSSE